MAFSVFSASFFCSSAIFFSSSCFSLAQLLGLLAEVLLASSLVELLGSSSWSFLISSSRSMASREPIEVAEPLHRLLELLGRLLPGSAWPWRAGRVRPAGFSSAARRWPSGRTSGPWPGVRSLLGLLHRPLGRLLKLLGRPARGRLHGDFSWVLFCFIRSRELLKLPGRLLGLRGGGRLLVGETLGLLLVGLFELAGRFGLLGELLGLGLVRQDVPLDLRDLVVKLLGRGEVLLLHLLFG